MAMSLVWLRILKIKKKRTDGWLTDKVGKRAVQYNEKDKKKKRRKR